MKKIILLALVISVAAIAAFFGTQRMCGVTPGSGRSALDRLDLTAGQRERIGALEASFSKAEIPLCMELCRKRVDLLRMLGRKESVDVEVEAQIQAIAALEAKLESRIAAHVLQVKGQLEPAQAEKYIENLRLDMQCPIDMKASHT